MTPNPALMAVMPRKYLLSRSPASSIAVVDFSRSCEPIRRMARSRTSSRCRSRKSTNSSTGAEGRQRLQHDADDRLQLIERRRGGRVQLDRDGLAAAGGIAAERSGQRRHGDGDGRRARSDAGRFELLLQILESIAGLLEGAAASRCCLAQRDDLLLQRDLIAGKLLGEGAHLLRDERTDAEDDGRRRRTRRE